MQTQSRKPRGQMAREEGMPLDIIGQQRSAQSGCGCSPELYDKVPLDRTTLAILELVKANDIYHPIHWPAWKRWVITLVYCLLQVFVTITSTSYVGAEWMIREKFGVGRQLATLGQSLFICGNAVGPAFLGPLA